MRLDTHLAASSSSPISPKIIRTLSQRSVSSMSPENLPKVAAAAAATARSRALTQEQACRDSAAALEELFSHKTDDGGLGEPGESMFVDTPVRGSRRRCCQPTDPTACRAAF